MKTMNTNNGLLALVCGVMLGSSAVADVSMPRVRLGGALGG